MTMAASACGDSATAHYIAEKLWESNRSLHMSHAFGIQCVLHELAEVWDDCRQSNWDGYNALPVTKDSFVNARGFLEALPLGFPRPSIAADPHGDFSLEWYHRRRRVLSLGITSDGLLHYAALLGPNKMSGTEIFSDEIPTRIIELVRRVYA